MKAKCEEQPWTSAQPCRNRATKTVGGLDVCGVHAPVVATRLHRQALANSDAQRCLYADAGPEMVRLLKILGDFVYTDVGTPIGTRAELDAVLKAVQPKKEKR